MIRVLRIMSSFLGFTQQHAATDLRIDLRLPTPQLAAHSLL